MTDASDSTQQLALPGPAPAARRGRGSRPANTQLAKVKADERQARQEMILLKTVCGQKAKDIAEELNLSINMVRTDLAAARRGDMLLAARDRIQSLIPKAIAALEVHLEEGDKDVALLVLEGLGVIGKHVQVSMMPPAGPGEESYEVFRARVVRNQSSGNQGSHQGSIAGTVAAVLPIIDAEVAEIGGPRCEQEGMAPEAVSVGGG